MRTQQVVYPLNQDRFTLKDLSENYGISLRDLRKHIKRGSLAATKVGRSYWVTASDLDKFLAALAKSPTRNYLCRYYDQCLDRAALANRIFDCEDCQRFVRAEKQVISAMDLCGMISLWESVFGRKLSF